MKIHNSKYYLTSIVSLFVLFFLNSVFAQSQATDYLQQSFFSNQLGQNETAGTWLKKTGENIIPVSYDGVKKTRLLDNIKFGNTRFYHVSKKIMGRSTNLIKQTNTVALAVETKSIINNISIPVWLEMKDRAVDKGSFFLTHKAKNTMSYDFRLSVSKDLSEVRLDVGI